MANGYTDYGHELRERYEDEAYDETVKALYDTMLPLYKELHAYVRHKLSNHYQIPIESKHQAQAPSTYNCIKTCINFGKYFRIPSSTSSG